MWRKLDRKLEYDVVLVELIGQLRRERRCGRGVYLILAFTEEVFKLTAGGLISR